MKSKLMSCLLALVLVVCGGVALTACSPDSNEQKDGLVEVVKYKVTFYDDDGATIISETQVESGATAVAVNAGKAGYDLVWKTQNGETADFTKAIAADTDFYATYEARKDTEYKVEHWFEDLNGEYKLDESKSEYKKGTTDSKVVASVITAEHFSVVEHDDAKTEGIVSGNGGLVLKLYYARERLKVSFVADGTTIDEKEVRYGNFVQITEKEVPTKNKTKEKEYRLKHWSESENGEAYEFGKAAGSDITLYAVYEEILRRYAVSADLDNPLYYFTYVNGDDIEYSDIEALNYGYSLSFSINLYRESVGTPVVKAVTVDDDENESTSVLEAVDDVYVLRVDGKTEIVVEGISARVYNLKINVAELHYDKEWAKPYGNLSEVSFAISERGSEDVFTADNAISEGAAILKLNAGNYDISAFVWESNDKRIISESVSVGLGYSKADEDGNVYSDSVMILADKTVITNSEAVLCENGYIENKDGKSFVAKMEQLVPGTSDFAVTVSYDQIMDDKDGTLHGDVALNDPSLGFVFTGNNGYSIDLPMYDSGALRVWESGEKKAEFRSIIASAGSLLGKLEWPDCYRHAEVTYIKVNGYFYITLTADGKAGIINTNGTFGTSSAKDYENFLLAYIDIENGVLYANKGLGSGTVNYNVFGEYKSDALKNVLSDISGVSFELAYGNGLCYARTSGYGWTFDKEILDDYEKTFKTAVTVSGSNDVTGLAINGEEYVASKIMKLGENISLSFPLPSGKIIKTFTVNGEDIKYMFNDGIVSCSMDTYLKWGAYNFVIELEDGQWFAQTAFSGAISVDDRFNDDLSNVMVRFVNYNGTIVRADYDAATRKYSAVVPYGIWDVYATNGYAMKINKNVSSGFSAEIALDFNLDDYATANSEATKNGGLTYNANDGSFKIKNENNTHENAIAGITFNPSTEVLEYGWTLTGMNAGNSNGHWPFMGMFVKSPDGGMMRLTWGMMGDQLVMITNSDDRSRAAMTDIKGNGAGGVQGWAPFGSKTNYYTFEKTNYKLSVKIRLDGYKLAVWVKTGEKTEWTQLTWDSFDNGTEFDIYAFYSVDTKRSMHHDLSGNRVSHLSELYSLDSECQFGVSGRRDYANDDKNIDATFSDIWFNIVKK